MIARAVDVVASRPDPGEERRRLEEALATGGLGRRRGVMVVHVHHVGHVERTLGRLFSSTITGELLARLDRARTGKAAVAQLGHGTFVVVNPSVPGPGWTDRYRQVLEPPIELQDLPFQVRAAVVVATSRYLPPERVLEMALDLADDLPQNAPGAVVEVDLDDHPPASEMDQLGQVLNRELNVARYQPVYRLDDLTMVGAEALVRMPGGNEAPTSMLRLAEVLGVEAHLTDAMLTQACDDFSHGAPAEAGWWVSGNIGAEEAADPTLPRRVSRILRATGMDPERLTLEVPETVVPQPDTVATLRAISSLGVHVALDDFGATTSTVHQLALLPIDTVKLDREIVHQPDRARARLFEAAVEVARSLDLSTVAEGIEHTEDLILAAVNECDMGQGYLWSRAVSRRELIAAAGLPPRRPPWHETP